MPLRVCFVALNAYPAIDPLVPGGIGGIETRSWMFARGLARRPDMEVSFALRHWQPLRQARYENVRLHLLRDRLYAVRESLALRLERVPGFPWIRLREPRWSDAVFLPLLAARKALIRRPDPLRPSPFYEAIDADLFLTFGVQSNSASVMASAHASGRKAVLFLGSDSDLDERYLTQAGFVSTYRDSAGTCLWTIQHADRILCQTEFQQARLQKLFQREATIVRNPIDLEEWDARRGEPLPAGQSAGLNRYALWIGRAEAEHKRPMVLVELARRCPEVEFLMILNRRDDVVDAAVRRAAPSNVRIIERAPFSAMPAILRQAAVLVNTSVLEGFPNTFLQAAASGVPVASLHVEPGFLQAAQAGFCAGGNTEALVEYVRACWTGAPVANGTPYDALFARRYVEEHYALDRQVDQLAGILQQVCGETPSPDRSRGESLPEGGSPRAG